MNSHVWDWNKCILNNGLPVHNDNINHNQSLTSCKPPWGLAKNLRLDGFNPNAKWIDEWKDKNPVILKLIENSTTRQPGFYWKRKDWVTLNRIWTRHGITGYMLCDWGLRPTPKCHGGSMLQTIEHIVEESPRRSFEEVMNNLHMVTRSSRVDRKLGHAKLYPLYLNQIFISLF